MNIQNLSASSLPSTAGTIKAKAFLTALLMAVISAALATLAQSLGINQDGTISTPHIPTWAELTKAGIAGVGAGIAYIIRKFFANDTPAAVNTVKEAFEKKQEIREKNQFE